MEREIIIFEHDSRLKFSRLFAEIAGHQMLYINVTQNSVLITRLYVLLLTRMCRGIGMYAYRSVTGISLVIMT